jgi:hypothetical protein
MDVGISIFCSISIILKLDRITEQCSFCEQEKELVQLKREARMKGGFYVSPEEKLLFVVRIRG